MPRGVKGSGPNAVNRVNNGPVDVPTVPSTAEKIAATDAALADVKAYRSQGKETPATPERPFGPGAEYPRYRYQTRLYDPANRAVYHIESVDIPLDVFMAEVDRWIENHSLVPCVASDIPVQREGRVQVTQEGSHAPQRRGRGASDAQRDYLARLGSELADDPDVTSEEASEEIERLKAAQKRNSSFRRRS